MKTSILTALVLLPVLSAQAQTTPLWRDINATERNAQTKRTELIMYPTREDALTKAFEQSPFYRSLNGEWDFYYTDDASTIPGDFSGLQWSSITVPGNWEFQGFGVPVYINIRYEFAPDDPQPPVIPEKVPAGVYRRTFTVPAEWEGRQLYLNLCGAKSGVYVYLNGAEVGYCEDSKDLARFDITSFVRDGENELTVLMHRWSAGSYLECQDFWRVSGFERDVYLSSEKSADYLDFKVVSTLAEDCTTGVFSFEGVQGSSFRLLDKDGSTVLEGGQRVLKAQIPDVRRWTAETPELYTLLVSKDGEYTRFDVGFRRIEIKGNVFYVNGQPIKFKGVNFHEHSQFTGHYLTRAEILANLKVMRQLNVNAIRTCHYPQGRAFYELCDSLGFYVYDEVNIESHGMGYDERSLAKDPAWLAKHLDRTVNMYRRTASYPCVTVLSLGNEAGNGVNFMATYKLLKGYEQGGMNRPVVYERAVAEGNTDFINPMYPDTRWLHNRGEEGTDKPVVLCEYSHAMGNSNGSFDWMWDEFYAYDHLQGGFIWDWIDQGVLEEDEEGRRFWTYGGDYGAYPMFETDWNFNCNGVVGPDIVPHPAGAEIKHVYQDVKVSSDDPASGSFVLTNRFYFKTLEGCVLNWEVTSDGVVTARGSKPLSLAAGQSEPLSVEIPAAAAGESQYITFHVLTLKESELLPEGFEIASDQFLLHKAERNTGLGKPLVFKDKGDRLIARGGGVKLVVSKETGFVRQFRVRFSNLIDKDFGLRPNLWRALTDNDWGNAYANRGGSAFMPDSLVLKDVRIEGNSAVAVYTLSNGCEYTLTYTPDRSGKLLVDLQFHGNPDAYAVEVPRIGVRTRIAKTAFRYFGRGPQENYQDRNSGSFVGLYESDPDKEFVPYVRPQECGHHTGCEWLESGRLRVEGGSGDFEFNLLSVTQENLDSYGADKKEVYKHLNDVQTVPFAELCIDYTATGVAGYDSWGSRPEPLRSLWAGEDYSYSFVLGRR